MNESFRPTAPRGGGRFALVSVVLLLACGPAAAQSFAVGGGGTVMADLGTSVPRHTFDNWGGFLFGEVVLDGSSAWHSTTLQLRWTRFSLPGGEPNAPDVSTGSWMMLVSYRFREAWWRAGFFGGAGLWHLSPRSPEAGQVVADPSQNVAGFCLGVDTVFEVTRRVDARIEASWQMPLSEYNHRVIAFSVALAYHF